MGKKDAEAQKRSTWLKSKMHALRPGRNKALPVQISPHTPTQSAQGAPVQSAQPQQSVSQGHGSIKANIPIIQDAKIYEEQIDSPKTMTLLPKQSHHAPNQYVPDQEHVRAETSSIETPRPFNNQTQPQKFTSAPQKRPERSYRRANKIAYQMLLNNGFDLASKRVNKEKALLWAIENGQDSAVNVLLIEGPNIDMIDDTQETFLHKVAYTPHRNVLRVLLSSEINVNARNNAGRTAMHITIAHGREALLRGLIDAGADLFAKTHHQSSALDLAIESKNERIVHLLLEKGLEAPLCIAGGEDKFQYMKASHSLYTVAQLLIAHGIESRERSGSEISALHAMVEKGQLDGIRILLKGGADVTAVDKLERSAVHFAAMGGQRKAIQMLLDHHGGKSFI